MLKIQTADGFVEVAGIHAGEGVDVAVENNVITLGLNESEIFDIVQQAAIYNINGKYAASDGSFYIHGSECDSWTPYREVVQVAADPATYEERVGISIVDLCPACSTCDTLYEIKKELEYLDIIVNMMKDVELHDTATLESNKAFLESMCINGGESCNYNWQPIVAQKGMQLLQQYVTIVHMWNYAVTQNNSSFKIGIAPEGASGFVVQTKRALPSCDGSFDIECSIDIDYFGVIMDTDAENPNPTVDTAAASKQLLSVYVPKPFQILRDNGGGTYLDFAPFVMNKVVDSTVVSAENAALQELNGTTLTPADAIVINYGEDQAPENRSYYRKTVRTPRINARVAGTYEISAKFLPFMPNIMTNSAGEVISVRGGTYFIGPDAPSGGTVSTRYYPSAIYQDQIYAPTERQYLDSNSVPTASVPWKNVWSVVITWNVYEHNGTDPKFQYVETKYYTCTGCRILEENAMVQDTEVPVEIIIPDPPAPTPTE